MLKTVKSHFLGTQCIDRYCLDALHLIMVASRVVLRFVYSAVRNSVNLF